MPDQPLITPGKALEVLHYYETPGRRKGVPDFAGMVRSLYEELQHYGMHTDVPTYVYHYISPKNSPLPPQALNRSKEDEGKVVKYDIGEGEKQGRVEIYMGDSLQLGNSWELENGDIIHEEDLR